MALALLASHGGAGSTAQTTTPTTTPQAATQPATTQPLIDDTAGRDVELTPEALQARIEQLEKSQEFDEALRARLADLYRQALARIQAAGESASRVAQYEQAIGQAPARLEALKADLAAPADDQPAPLDASLTLAQLEALAAEAERALGDAKRAVENIDAETKNRSARRLEIPKLLADAAQRLEQVEREISQPAPADEPVALTLAKRTLALARREAIARETAALDAESRSYDARDDLQRALLDLANRRSTIAERRYLPLREALSDRRMQEAERARRDAERQARDAASQAHSIVPTVAEENVRLAAELSSLAAKLKADGDRKAVVDRVLPDLEQQYRNARETVEQVGLTNATGQILRQRRAELPQLRDHRRTLAQIEANLADLRFALLQYEEQRQRVANLDEAVARRVAAADPPVAAADRERVEAALRERLDAQRSSLNALIKTAGERIRLLADLYVREKKLVALVSAYTGFIDEHVLWIRSDQPLSLQDLTHVRRTLDWLADGQLWIGVANALRSDVRENPATYALGLSGFALLFVARRRLARRLPQLAELAARPTNTAFMPTFTALVDGAVTAAFWPAMLAFLGWRLAAPVDALDFSKGLAAGCWDAAKILFWAEFLRQMCRPGGVGEVHIGWPSSVLARLRRQILFLILAALPAIVLGNAVEALTSDVTRGSTTRLMTMWGIGVLAVFLHYGLRPTGGSLQAPLSIVAGSWLHRVRHVWYALGVGLPLFLLLLAAAGYAYSAAQLAWCLQASLWLILRLAVFYGVIVRFLTLSHRRTALELSRKKLAAEQTQLAAAAQSYVEDVPTISTPVVVEDVDLPTISAQTRQLLRIVIGFVLIVGLWWIWVSVLPALGVLRQVRVWAGVTFADLIVSVGALLLTVMAARNIPSLLEITLLQRLPLEQGVRYAVSTISRYVLTIVGLVAVFGTLGVAWADVQWLVAAMTVGLGFGLQEVFANFVSGLILLFERPIRVGDLVTIGARTGRVMRIRIRATTIVDADRKELIIPNKELITGQVVNWTLSDTLQRVLIPVGVAYDADPRVVRNLLLKTARANPRVLKQPEPTAFFVGYGDSTLNFELACFVAVLEDMFQVRHQINTAIKAAFDEAGVSFAFPTREVIMHAAPQRSASVGDDRPAAERPAEGATPRTPSNAAPAEPTRRG
ncbi:MAG: mechanosensitive ion channel domain-containing protein [Phycisphaerae bacterium]